ncbi:MAG: hypothetical protein KDC50_07330, partial [Flavobacterium sp.]|nr:hypothetical protein [Flavobacterium sp.]
MFNKSIGFVFILFFNYGLFAQTDSLYVAVDTTQVVKAVNEIANKNILLPVFDKIKQIQTEK